MQFFSRACPAKAFGVVYNANSVETRGKVIMGLVLPINEASREASREGPPVPGGQVSLIDPGSLRIR